MALSLPLPSSLLKLPIVYEEITVNTDIYIFAAQCEKEGRLQRINPSFLNNLM